MVMKWMLGALGLLGCVLPFAVQADTIYMKDTNLRIEGKILRETSDYVLMMVFEDHGQIRIPKDKIRKIEYDIKTQLANLKDDDYAGHYKVALWAMDKGLYNDVISILTLLDGKEGVGPDFSKVFGQSYDKTQQLDKALARYNDYIKLHPDDAEITARIAELTKLVNPESASGPQPAKNLDSGLAGSGTWQDEKWPDAIPCTCQMTTDKDGKNNITVQSAGGAKDKAAFTRTGNLNLKESKEMVFRICQNSATPINIAIAMIDSKNEFMESKQFRVPGNTWSTLSLKLDEKSFKSAANQWKHVDALDNRDNVQRIVFLVYERRPVTLWIDGIFFK